MRLAVQDHWYESLPHSDIFVPPHQVIDTVDLYYLPTRSRRLSLRFLAWFFFRDNIQTDTHDSIEDALTALKLYKAHLQFEAEGTFDKQLENIYKEGRQYVSFLTTLQNYITLSRILSSELQASPAARLSTCSSGQRFYHAHRPNPAQPPTPFRCSTRFQWKYEPTSIPSLFCTNDTAVPSQLAKPIEYG